MIRREHLRCKYEINIVSPSRTLIHTWKRDDRLKLPGIPEFEPRTLNSSQWFGQITSKVERYSGSDQIAKGLKRVNVPVGEIRCGKLTLGDGDNRPWPDLGGIVGADAHYQALALAVGAGNKTSHPYQDAGSQWAALSERPRPKRHGPVVQFNRPTPSSRLPTWFSI